VSSITPSTPTSAKRRFGAVAVLAATAALLAACGSSSSGSSGSEGTGGAGGSVSSGGAPGTNAAAGFRPVTGKVASVGGAGARVSTTSGMTNVAFASSTRFTLISAISRSALKVGDCISATSGSTGDATSSTNSTIKATSITVTSGTACSQTRSFGRGSGGFTPPAGAPRGGEGFSGGLPPGAGSANGTTGSNPQRLRAHFGGAAGTITAVSATTIEVNSQFPRVLGSSTKAGSTPTKVTVTTTASTTYRNRSTATAAAVSTGKCLTAVGQKTGSGVVDAFMVTVSSPTNGSCTLTAEGAGSGFGGGFGGGFGEGPGGAQPGGAQPGGTTNG
jgi:hypothetical protein